MVGNALYGGLGNILFQISASFAHAKRNGFEHGVVNSVTNPHERHQDPYIFPGINYIETYNGIQDYKERHYHHCEIPPVDNIRLDGYFQSAKYFNEYRDELIDVFGLEVKKIIQKVCGIHVRRGDYLKFPDHHVAMKSGDAFSAIGLMHQKTGIRDFLVFSDDIPWCQETFGMLNRFDFEYSENSDPLDDMRLFASCTHQIGSASTFSWWGHYINPNPDKIGVFPHQWFGKALDHNIKDLYTNSMIRI